MNFSACNQSASEPARRTAAVRSMRAFTLIELLAVIAIIGILASLAAPIMSRFGAGDKLSAGGRQMLDELAFARSKAMATRSTVYVVFLPNNINANTIITTVGPYATNYLDRVALTNLSGMTFSGYALYSEHSVGDQPGTYSPRYLTKWKELPTGVSIHEEQFYQVYATARTNFISGQYVKQFSYRNFPFPNADSAVLISLPYLAFNPMGQLVGGENFRVQVTEAYLGRPRDAANQNQLTFGQSTFRGDAPNAVLLEWETRGIAEGVNYTNYTIYAHEIEINWLTGRGKFLQPQIQ
jgi:prepilin-type N-terminal cleavage/methylation domain-containing protein